MLEEPVTRHFDTNSEASEAKTMQSRIAPVSTICSLLFCGAGINWAQCSEAFLLYANVRVYVLSTKYCL